jgi:predicted TIM-barrel fold metal-dependent hydrolase
MSHLVIDSDGHIVEPIPLWEERLPANLRDRGLIVNREDPQYQTISGVELPPRHLYAGRETDNKMGEVLKAERYQHAVVSDFSARSTLESMDVEGIDASVLFPSRGLFLMGVDERVDPEVTTASASVYNDWLSEYTSEAPDRLFGVAMIDPRDIPGAIAELHRGVEELGMVGAFLRPNPVNGIMWHDPAYDPLWSELEALDVPVCFHEAGAVLLPQVATDRFDHHSMWHVCTHPQENQISMVSFVLGGVLERHPNLRVSFLECGAGWLPYWMWRMDEHYENEQRTDFADLHLRPSEYVSRQCWVSIDSDEWPGISALDACKGHNVVWGSDYPHPDGKFPTAIKTLRSIPGMTAEHFANVVGSSPLALFGPRLAERVRQPEG